jgi:GT2 family glycosyltransferase
MLNASIVLYKHSVSEIVPLVETLLQSGVVAHVYLIDNSPVEEKEFKKLNATYIFNDRNLGYGAAHNIAIRQTIHQQCPYHLVVNPDIAFDTSILEKLIKFMESNSEIGSAMPKVLYPDGRVQYLCKLIPSPFDLIFRRFLPNSWTRKRMDQFELRATGYNQIMDVPYLSGCFMFLRSKALEEVGLFDERFFMYPEDIDLTRRIHSKYRTIFYPEVQVIHHHAQGSYKSGRLLYIHISNMIQYFNKWGWVFDGERRSINKEVLRKLFK